MPILLQESLWHHVLQKFFSQTHGLLLRTRNEAQMVSRLGLAQPGDPGMRAAHLWMAGTVSAFLRSRMDIDWSSTEALFVCITMSATVARTGKRNFVLWFCKTDHGKCGVVVLAEPDFLLPVPLLHTGQGCSSETKLSCSKQVDLNWADVSRPVTHMQMYFANSNLHIESAVEKCVI